jgi:uncharacterized membrane protein
VLRSVRHHARFFTALVCGLIAFATAWAMGLAAPLPTLAAGNIFYVVFLILIAVLIVRDQADLKARAGKEDEGILVVVLLTMATIVFFCLAVFEALSHKRDLDVLALVLAGTGALMGWFVLHAIMGFHYADLFYFDDPRTPREEGHDLDFPGCDEPDVWDFLYFSFVIGMTCQVSDVQVKSSAMRQTVLAHGVVSFFFNTVFIAMAVNAGVALAA